MLGELPNILEIMLTENENIRVSTLKLACIISAKDLLIDSKINDPFEYSISKPIIEFLNKN